MVTLVVILFVILTIFIMATTMVGSATHDLKFYQNKCSYKAKFSNEEQVKSYIKNLDYEPQPGEKIKIAVVSLSVGRRNFAAITKERLGKYCDHHGYDFYYFDETVNADYSVMWQKCLAVRNILEKGEHDAVIWFDDDIYVTNFGVKLEEFLELAPDKDILFCQDIVKDDPNVFINTGQYFLRNTDKAKEFINETIENYDNFDGYFKKGRYHEQSIMTYLFYIKYFRVSEVLPYGTVHSFHPKNPWWMELFRGTYRSWKYGDFSLHLAGMKNKRRFVLLEKIKNYDITIDGHKMVRKEWEKVM